MKLPLTIYAKREIRLFAGIFLLLFVILLFAKPILCLLPLALGGFVLYFFRDPARHVNARGKDVLAPADGSIVEIEKVFDKTSLNAEVWKVGIFLSLFDVHINRSPCAGVVESVRFRRGKFHNASSRAASERNERSIIGIHNKDFNVRLIVKQIAGVIARRIVCELTEGQEVLAGHKFGMIKFGSRTELYVPVEHFILKVKVGQRVKAGISILGELK